jgi:acid stress-induced BolA-like protein IbaG/YrbA
MGAVAANISTLFCASARPARLMNASEVASLIRTGLPDADIRVASDDDTHFEAVVVAAEFAGKRMIARHQLVYATLGARMGREIHALSIKAYTPEEWARSVGSAGQT